MNQTGYSSLARAFALSLALHALLLVSGSRLYSFLPSAAGPSGATLRVTLAETFAVADPAPQPPLMREDTSTTAVPAPVKPQPPRLERPPGAQKPATGAMAVQELSGEAAAKAAQQISQELFYPLEAVARGLEGEVLVLVFLDAAGNAIAARVERGSGHALLDDAAVRAARTLRSLPAAAPREALVPVRFRLR